MNPLRFLRYGFLLAGLAASVSAPAETVKDREGAVREDRAKMEGNARWIYNDVDAGFAVAAKTGKPLMVVLRCVPCLACMGIDTQVLTETAELTPLMDQFVRVRVINANALDLSRFQFDFDLSFSTLFFNADGTLYGRYGSWAHQKDSQNQATASFKRALEGVLGLHQNYPAIKAALEGKQGKPSRYKTPVDIPGLEEKFDANLDWDGKVVQSCVHCHMIGSGQRADLRDNRQAIPQNLIYPFPAPEDVGITLSEDAVAKVQSVEDGSPAALAGLKAGDEILALAGQPLISTADISWALHETPDAGELAARVRRDGKDATLGILLPDGWRSKSDISRRVGTWGMRAMAFGGAVFVELPDEERARHGLRDDQLALLAKGVGKYGKHAAAKNAGWKAGDILIEIDGSDARFTESQLIGRFIRGHKPGENIPATVLRGGDRVPLRIPIQ